MILRKCKRIVTLKSPKKRARKILLSLLQPIPVVLYFALGVICWGHINFNISFTELILDGIIPTICILSFIVIFILVFFKIYKWEYIFNINNDIFKR